MIEDISLSVGLRKLRIEKGLKQKTLADLSGVAKGYISDMECGRRNITQLSVGRLLKALETSYKDFIVNYCDLTNEENIIEEPSNTIEETEPTQLNFITKTQIAEHLQKVITFYEDYTSDLLKETTRDYREDIIDLKETGYEYRLELDKILIQVEE